MYNVVNTLEPSFLIGSSSFLQVTRTNIKSWMILKFGQIRPWTAELAALELLKKSPYFYHGRNVVTTLAPSFLIGTSSFLQVTRTAIKSRMSSKLSQIQPLTAELDALDQLKKSFTYLKTIQYILITCWLSGKRS